MPETTQKTPENILENVSVNRKQGFGLLCEPAGVFILPVNFQSLFGPAYLSLDATHRLHE